MKELQRRRVNAGGRKKIERINNEIRLNCDGPPAAEQANKLRNFVVFYPQTFCLRDIKDLKKEGDKRDEKKERERDSETKRDRERQ